MTEKDMQVLFGKYLKDNPPKETEVYELKICKGNSLPFNSVKQHQIDALSQTQTSSFYHKLTDPPVFYGMKTRFNVKRPFDCFCLVKVNAYLVFWFYKPRQPKQFIKIGIKDFLRFEEGAVKKSFREEEILNVANEVINI